MLRTTSHYFLVLLMIKKSAQAVKKINPSSISFDQSINQESIQFEYINSIYPIEACNESSGISIFLITVGIENKINWKTSTLELIK